MIVFNAINGEKTWSEKFAGRFHSSIMAVDPTGRNLAFSPDPSSGSGALIALPSGGRLGDWTFVPMALSPGAEYGSRYGFESHYKLYLYRKPGKAPLVSLGIDAEPSVVAYNFNPSGTHLAWGNYDGTVILCDIAEVQRRLAAIGLGW